MKIGCLFWSRDELVHRPLNHHHRGLKQELQDIKKYVNLSLADCEASIDTKFDVISNRLDAIEENFQRHD